MKVVLTRPCYRSYIISPPIGMGYVSSYLKKFGHDAKIIDGLNLGISNDEIVKRCKEFGAKLVGIYVISAYFLDAVDLIKKLKKENMIVVLGGTHPTFMPKFTLEKSGADYIIAGEGEPTMLDLVDALENNKDTKMIPGLYSKGTEQIIDRPFLEDLDSLPFPDWEQIDPREYKKAPHGGLIRHFPYAPISSTRGCPYRCTFCASPKFSKRNIRFRSPENVVAEIKYLADNFNIKEIHFEDDNLTLKRDHIINLCNLLIKEKVKVSWACPNGVRADKVDKEMLDLMKKSGCYYTAFGIESGSQKILDNVKKDIKIEQIIHGVELAAQAGIMTQGFFIFGLPGETEETIEETIKFAKSLPLTRAQFLVLDVMPGTELWDVLEFEKKVDWTKTSYHEITWQAPTVSKEILAKAAPRAFKEFYFRPKQLLSLMRYFRISQTPFVIKRLLSYGVLNFLKTPFQKKLFPNIGHVTVPNEAVEM